MRAYINTAGMAHVLDAINEHTPHVDSVPGRLATYYCGKAEDAWNEMLPCFEIERQDTRSGNPSLVWMEPKHFDLAEE